MDSDKQWWSSNRVRSPVTTLKWTYPTTKSQSNFFWQTLRRIFLLVSISQAPDWVLDSSHAPVIVPFTRSIWGWCPVVAGFNDANVTIQCITYIAAECRVIRVVNDKGRCLYEWSHGYIFKNITFFASTWTSQQQLSYFFPRGRGWHVINIYIITDTEQYGVYKTDFIGMLVCKTTSPLRWTWSSAVAVDDVNKIIW